MIWFEFFLVGNKDLGERVVEVFFGLDILFLKCWERVCLVLVRGFGCVGVGCVVERVWEDT